MEIDPAGPADQPWLEALAADPAVEPFLGITTDVGAAVVAGEMYVLREGNTRIGGVRIHLRHPISRIGSIHALMITPGLRGRGMGEAAVRETAALAFSVLGQHRLEAEVFVTNEAGVRTFAAAGFAEEGRRRTAYWRHGAWQDTVLFALINPME